MALLLGPFDVKVISGTTMKVLMFCVNTGHSAQPPCEWNNIIINCFVFVLHLIRPCRAVPSEANADWVLATSNYGEDFVAAVCNGSAMATQFHPEKSGTSGLDILRGFLEPESPEAQAAAAAANMRQLAFVGGAAGTGNRGLARRVIACLDVRSNDNGDLVVTKGDQYDVREKDGDRDVRNLGKPVDLAAR